MAGTEGPRLTTEHGATREGGGVVRNEPAEPARAGGGGCSYTVIVRRLPLEGDRGEINNQEGGWLSESDEHTVGGIMKSKY